MGNNEREIADPQQSILNLEFEVYQEYGMNSFMNQVYHYSINGTSPQIITGDNGIRHCIGRGWIPYKI